MGTVVVIGGGPAGMMAAGTAAANGADVILLEKNEKVGKKLYITGKGRCNVTSACGYDGLLSAVMANARFLQSCFSVFGSDDTITFFERLGVALKVERGRRVFPVSDKASDITKALESFMYGNNVKLMCGHKVLSVSESFKIETDKGIFKADAVVVATGGLSYPVTGSDGDGYRIAKKLGHTVTSTYASLVPLVVSERWVSNAEGLSLRNVRCSVFLPGKKKPVFSEVGEMLFTSDGVTGPLILTASRYITDKLEFKPVISVDLKPALEASVLDERIRRDFSENPNRNFSNSLDKLLPQKLIGVIVGLSGIEPERKVNSVTRRERFNLTALLKDLRLNPTSTAGFNEAVITAGGVDVKEINPSTMMSKIVNGLFFAGEVLDVDALTGGFNLQIAFSTGKSAGKSAAVRSINKYD